MVLLFYNEGTRDHRGVWHKAYSINYKTIPETRREERAVSFDTYKRDGSFKETLGFIYVTSVTPEHVETRITTECGSFTDDHPYIDDGLDYGTGNWKDVRKKENIGKHVEYSWGPSKLILMQGHSISSRPCLL
jgi:hypothetical protein